MAKKKRISHCDAKAMLQKDGIDFSRDFHELPSSDVSRIVDAARSSGYRKSKTAPGSRGRMYYQLLQRQRSC